MICHEIMFHLDTKKLTMAFCFSFFFNVLQLDRQTLSIAIRFLKAKTPEQRAAVDLDTHYSKVKNKIGIENLLIERPLEFEIWQAFVESVFYLQL